MTRGARRVTGAVNYVAEMSVRPRYHANDSSRDVLALEERKVGIEDARSLMVAPTLQREGFALVAHRSCIENFRDAEEVASRHPREVEALVRDLSGADAVVVAAPGVLRFAESSADCGRLNNSRPARFVHVDVSDATAAAFAQRSCPAPRASEVRRFAHYNVWRAISPPPQDVPLAVCDARSVQARDLVPADAVFDAPGRSEWSFEGLVLRFNPAHRWCYYPQMTRGEALVFKTHDSAAGEPRHVPHSAFNDPSCPAPAPPRASIEMRAIAYWFQ